MAEHIYPRPGLAVVDRDRLLVFGPPAGPAGSSSVELPDGSAWQVDHADPAIPVLIDVDAADPGRSPLLTAAFGGDAALFIADDAHVMSTDGSFEEFLERSRPHPMQSGSRQRPVRNNLARELGTLVLLADLTVDERLHPLIRVAASIDLALSARSRLAGSVLGPIASAGLERVGDLVHEVDDDDLELLDPQVRHALRSTCRSTQKITRRVLPPLADLAGRLDRIDDGADFQVSAMRLTMDTPGEPADELLAAAAPDRSAQPGSGGEPVIRRIDDALVRVTVARSGTERWARVIDRHGMVLLGQAPLRRDGLVDVAEVVVPADASDEDLEVRVAGSDELRALLGRPTEVIRAAVTAGREAARADRLGRTSISRTRWEHCAELWAGVGDRQRSRLAFEYAHGRTVQARSPSSTTDEIAETLAPAF